MKYSTDFENLCLKMMLMTSGKHKKWGSSKKDFEFFLKKIDIFVFFKKK